MVNVIQNNDLKKALESKAAVLDFSATWCGPCKMLAPIMDELSEELAGQAEFFNIDVDQNRELAIQFGISNIPAVMFMKDGKVVDTSIGFQPKPNMLAFVKDNL